jgi:hypothetical protein
MNLGLTGLVVQLHNTTDRLHFPLTAGRFGKFRDLVEWSGSNSLMIPTG